MSAHNILAELSTALNALTGTGGQWLSCWAGVPTASAVGYAPCGLAFDTTNKKVYTNTGTVASATWTVVGSQS